MKVINAVIAQQGKVRIHDPEAMEGIHRLYHNNPNVKIISNKYDALRNADAMILLTEWPEYWSPDFNTMLKQMRVPLIIDGRNVFNREHVESQGFTYYSIGR